MFHLAQAIFKTTARRTVEGAVSVLPFWPRNTLLRKLKPVYSKTEDAHKIIFIHVPKVAGNAIIKSLYGTSALGHNTLDEYRNDNITKYNHYYKIGFCRNPWDRAVSSYSYLKQGGRGRLDIEFRNKYLNNTNSFTDFVLKLQDDKYRNHILKWIHFIPQIRFLSIDNKTIGVDFLGRYENINEDFKSLCISLNRQPISLIKDNKSIRNEYRQYYNKETVNIIQYIYKQDIDLFGYEF